MITALVNECQCPRCSGARSISVEVRRLVALANERLKADVVSDGQYSSFQFLRSTTS
jgi:hypothetical protein